MVHNNDDAMNKIPLKSATGLDDEEKNGGELIHDNDAAEEARREQRRAKLLAWMKKLTIVLICFIGIALISYVIISLCFSDDNSNNNAQSTLNTTTTADDPNNNANKIIAAAGAAIGTATATTTTTNNAGHEKPAIAASTSADAATATLKHTTAIPTITTTTTTTKPTATTSTKNTLQDTPNIAENFKSTLDSYEKAAVCSDRQVCSQIGSNVLAKNGSAVDAAIATMLCNGLLSPQSMGLGGGLIMNVYIRKVRQAYSIDAREVAPYSARPDMFDANPEAAVSGPLAIAVPGEVMGYHKAHERFGKLPWPELVEPSLKLCQDGYYMSKHQLNGLKSKWQVLKDNEQIRATYVNAETGEIHPAGTKLKPPTNLCDTYRLLAKNGPLDFYTGALSKLIMEDLNELGSPMIPYDLEAYLADLVSSITMQLGDDTLYVSPPVSSGTVVAHILSILEGYNLTKSDMLGTPEQQALTIHRFTEAFKLGFAKRWELGDLRFTDVRELISKLTDPSFGDEQRAKINDSGIHNEISEYGAQFTGNEDTGTSQIVVLAPNGDAVSVTSSINDYFGAGLIGPRTGIVFNSGMNDFSVAKNIFQLPPSPSNTIDGRKRAMSSQSPVLLTDRKGNIRLVVGGAGGPKIINGVVETIARVLWFGQNIKEAVDAPRFYHQLLPNVLEYEAGGFNDELLKLLREKGHVLKERKEIGSVVYGIVRNETAVYANADYRKRGGTAGF